ncbi:RTA1-domain-containing protein [Pyrenochaeta sp. DS3sAY3a]|nr:RTA1-domain-containing protein [Pyrenochaeta sp. DS3sAY3a]
MSSSIYENCTEVTSSCPVSGTIYGYYPSLGGNGFFLAVFIVAFMIQIPLAFIYHLWGYSFALGAGTFMEIIGYVGRIQMHSNPWKDSAFTMQVTCLILAPSFIAASIYLTFKHLIIAFGPEHSRLKPRLYTWIFIGCDICSILLQAGGGGMASSGGPSQAKTGNNIMIGGIAFQVVTMAMCGILAGDFAIKYHKSKTTTGSKWVWNPRQMSRPVIFCATAAFAYTVVLIRCIYRIPEMAGGWGGELMRHEGEFLALDGLMVALGVTILTLSFPGYMFPGMMSTDKAKNLPNILHRHGHKSGNAGSAELHLMDTRGI